MIYVLQTLFHTLSTRNLPRSTLWSPVLMWIFITKTSGFVTALFRLMHIVDLSLVFQGKIDLSCLYAAYTVYLGLVRSVMNGAVKSPLWYVLDAMQYFDQSYPIIHKERTTPAWHSVLSLVISGLYPCWLNKSLVTYNQHVSIFQFFDWFGKSMSAWWLKALFMYGDPVFISHHLTCRLSCRYV